MNTKHYNFSYLFLIYIATGIYSCKEYDPGPVESNFTASITTIDAGESITFTDLSTGRIKERLWTFETDGIEIIGPEVTEEENPTFTFELPGLYMATLSVSNKTHMDEIVKSDYILVLPSENLIAKYEMNGNAMDTGPNNLDGAIRNTVQFVTDRKEIEESSASFDGINSAIDLGTSTVVGVRTFSLWFNSDLPVNPTLNEYYPFIARDTDYFVTNNADEFSLSFAPIAGKEGKIVFNLKDGSGNSYSIYSDSDTWPADEWFHLVGIIDPIVGMKMYINGQIQIETFPFTEATGATDYISAIGTWGNLNERYFDGQIDDVRLYSSALSEELIQLLYLDR